MQQPPKRVQGTVLHFIPGFHHDLQVTHRPELPPTDPYRWGNHLVGTIVLKTLFQIGALLAAQVEDISPCQRDFSLFSPPC
jgi:hypothetical protein